MGLNRMENELKARIKENERKIEYERIAQRYTFLVNRIEANKLKIERLTELGQSEGIQLVIDYLKKENKSLKSYLFT